MSRYLTHFSIASLILLAAVGAYASWYLFVRAAAERAAAFGQELDRAVANVTDAADLRDMLSSLAGDEAAINARFVAVEDIALFLETLEATGRGLGATVDVMTVADRPTPDNRISLTLRIRGEYESVLRTIGALEYGPHDARVENLTLNAGGAEQAGEWTATANLSVGIARPATATP